MKILSAYSSFGLTADDADEFVAGAVRRFLTSRHRRLAVGLPDWGAYTSCVVVVTPRNDEYCSRGAASWIEFIRLTAEGLVLIGGC